MVIYSDYDSITAQLNIDLRIMQINYTNGYFVVNSLLQKRCFLDIVVANNMLFLI
jgi:hypothetical protein